MTDELPKMQDRQVMQRLKLGEWKEVWRLGVRAGEKLLQRLVRLGWIEHREQDGRRQIRITPMGVEALKATLPAYSYQRRSR